MKQLTFAVLLLSVVFVQGQTTTPYDSFIKKFNSRMDTVQWLCEYDDIAWWTSDSVYATPKEEQQKLGSEWFCFYKDNSWHALYGKYHNNNFETVYHYIVDSSNHIARAYEKFDSVLLNPYARALINANNSAQNFPDSQKVRFNQYIKRNADQTLSVWLLPAFTGDGIAVYGGEFYYLYDKSGNKLLSKAEYSIGYRGFKPDSKKEINLDYSTFEEPPLSAVFFAWYYKRYFDKITISTQKFASTPFKVDGSFTWLHAAKDK